MNLETLLYGVALGVGLAALVVAVNDHVLPAVHERLDVLWLHRENARRDRAWNPRAVEAERTLQPPVRSAPAGPPITTPAGALSSETGGIPRPARLAPTPVDVVTGWRLRRPPGLQEVRHG